ncbi:hypothetical protein LSAT2_008078, partial [Lamellibrachia satsuma]
LTTWEVQDTRFKHFINSPSNHPPGCKLEFDLALADSTLRCTNLDTEMTPCVPAVMPPDCRPPTEMPSIPACMRRGHPGSQRSSSDMAPQAR